LSYTFENLWYQAFALQQLLAEREVENLVGRSHDHAADDVAVDMNLTKRWA